MMRRKTRIEQTLAVIEQELNDPSVDFAFGAVKQARISRPRRILWVRPGGDVGAPGVNGGLLRTPEESAEDGNGSLNGDRTDFCYSVVDTAVAQISAEDEAAAEHLFYALLAAIKRACGHHARPSSFRWPIEEVGGSITHRSRVDLTVSFTFLAPEAVTGLVVILATQHTHVMNGNPDQNDHNS